MEGGCHAAVVAYAEIRGQTMNLHAFVVGLDGCRYIKCSVQGTTGTWRLLARRLADELLAAGGKNILRESEV